MGGGGSCHRSRNLSSIGDLMMTVGALAAVKAPKAEGLGFGGKILPPVFSGKNIKVKGAVAKINGLVNEYATSAAQVRARWPMGLQVPPRQVRGLYGGQGCSPGRQGLRKGWQLRVRERPLCWSFQQTQRLCLPRFPYVCLRGCACQAHLQAHSRPQDCSQDFCETSGVAGQVVST